MAKSIKAFPNSSPFNSKEEGMCLSQYYAGKALQGLCANPLFIKDDKSNIHYLAGFAAGIGVALDNIIGDKTQ